MQQGGARRCSLATCHPSGSSESPMSRLKGSHSPVRRWRRVNRGKAQGSSRTLSTSRPLAPSPATRSPKPRPRSALLSGVHPGVTDIQSTAEHRHKAAGASQGSALSGDLARKGTSDSYGTVVDPCHIPEPDTGQVITVCPRQC